MQPTHTQEEDQEEDNDSRYCTSKAKTPFRMEIESITTAINDANKYSSTEEVHQLMKNISHRLIPTFSKSRVGPNIWMASPNLQFLPNQIVLLALSNAPIRCLAVIVKGHGDTAKDVVEGLKYSIFKIIKKQFRKKSQPHLVIETPTNGRASGYLCTSKRGFYLIEKKTYDMKMTAVPVKGGGFSIRNENAHDINEIFFTKVDGMHLRPDKGFRRLKEDLGMEQFLLNEYPTPEWKTHVNNLKEEGEGEDKGRFCTPPDSSEGVEPLSKKQKKIDEPIGTCVGKFVDINTFDDTNFQRYTRITDTVLCNWDPTQKKGGEEEEKEIDEMFMMELGL